MSYEWRDTITTSWGNVAMPWEALPEPWRTLAGLAVMLGVVAGLAVLLRWPRRQ